ncbi:MAG: hypothetical protein OEZ58_07535 [Gammaproteobacteria bacterium]|nr:hypothetical protein [Gammaproteobacteria bacterium]
MRNLPQAYLDLNQAFSQLLKSKPKKNYVESIVTDGQPDPIDAIESASVAVRMGDKQKAIHILYQAKQSSDDRKHLAYLGDIDHELTILIQQLESLPVIESPQTTPDSQAPKRSLIIFAAVAIIVFVFISVFVIE